MRSSATVYWRPCGKKPAVKARKRIGLLSALCRLAMAGALSICAAGAAAGETREVGVIKSVQGAAHVRRAGEDRPAVAGDALQLGDEISTGPDGALVFGFPDGGRFAIGPNSTVVVAEFEIQRDEGFMAGIARLIYGTVTPTPGQDDLDARKTIARGAPPWSNAARRLRRP